MLTTYRNVVGLAVLASCSVACRSDVSMDDAAVEDALGGGGGTLTIDGTKVMVTDGTGIAGQPKFALNVVASDGTKLAFAADQCAGSVRSEAVQTRLAITCGNKSGVFVSLLQQWATSDGNKVGLALLVAVPRKDTLARNLANSLLPSGEISLESSSSDQLILYSSATQWPSKDPHATLQSYNKTLAGLMGRSLMHSVLNESSAKTEPIANLYVNFTQHQTYVCLRPAGAIGAAYTYSTTPKAPGPKALHSLINQDRQVANNTICSD